MAERDQSLAVPPGDRRVSHDERRHLDAAAVVLGDDLFGDVTLDIADQLLARRSELGEVIGEGGDQSAQRGWRDPLLRRLELPRREVDSVGRLA